ncbi:MAG: restriction endonuclease [Bacteroidetes bacterium]|nr:restriction endonuclease [Bacteroidota bacterium]MCW5897081.1 restriction endonuclease [Bacteroidota bacterium]
MNGKGILESKGVLLNEIVEVLSDHTLRFESGRSSAIKQATSRKLNKCGWADTIRIGTSNLSINFMKDRVGLCLQLGNVARTYADILKMQYLYEKKVIDVGIIAVPVYEASKQLGANYAEYGRLTKELKLFQAFVTGPIVVFGLAS